MRVCLGSGKPFLSHKRWPGLKESVLMDAKQTPSLNFGYVSDKNEHTRFFLIYSWSVPRQNTKSTQTVVFILFAERTKTQHSPVISPVHQLVIYL